MRTVMITLAISVPLTAFVTAYICLRIPRIKAAWYYYKHGSSIG